MKHLVLCAGLVFSACSDGSGSGETDDLGTEDLGTEVLPELFAVCDPLSVDMGEQTPTGDCVQSQTVAGGTKALVRADCTDPTITGNLDKRHLVMVPDAVTTEVLWLHLGGTGGQPTNTETVGETAMMAGYRYISLAFMNNVSASERCRCDDGPRIAGCEGLVRYEVVYGDDVTELFDMQADEAIVPRLTALLASLHDRSPNAGWDRYVDASGEVRWSDIAVSGFSQGGGMAGLIARDHAVDRAMYLSKGAGAVLGAIVDPSTAQTCTDDDECAGARCCPVTDLQCDAPGDDAICLELVPALYASEGADTDGDGRGDGDVSQRATPGDRQFAVIHRAENAYETGPAIFASWGMDTAEVDVDSVSAPYSPSARFFSTAAPARNDCSDHQSMGADSCLARDVNGDVVVQQAWLHAMNAAL